jgi:hypothetical protein
MITTIPPQPGKWPFFNTMLKDKNERQRLHRHRAMPHRERTLLRLHV